MQRCQPNGQAVQRFIAPLLSRRHVGIVRTPIVLSMRLESFWSSSLNLLALSLLVDGWRLLFLRRNNPDCGGATMIGGGSTTTARRSRWFGGVILPIVVRRHRCAGDHGDDEP